MLSPGALVITMQKEHSLHDLWESISQQIYSLLSSMYQTEVAKQELYTSPYFLPKGKSTKIP